jgi:hypothetical protein
VIKYEEGDFRDILLSEAREKIAALEAENADLKAIVESVYGALPSYLGASETVDKPCLRRVADELLGKKE